MVVEFKSFLPPFNPLHLLHSNCLKNQNQNQFSHHFLKMKLIRINSKTFSPKRIFGSRKDRSKLSRSEPPSFGSGSTSSSTGTPTQQKQLSGDWSDFSDARKEMEGLLRLFGADPPTEEELKMIMGELDRVGPACDSDLRDTFEIFDANHDGRITAEELFSVFATMGGDHRCTLEDCRRMIAGVDKNGDGFVCFDDFARMMDTRG